jgi:hypothetical protein
VIPRLALSLLAVVALAVAVACGESDDSDEAARSTEPSAEEDAAPVAFGVAESFPTAAELEDTTGGSWEMGEREEGLQTPPGEDTYAEIAESVETTWRSAMPGSADCRIGSGVQRDTSTGLGRYGFRDPAEVRLG